MKSSLAGLKAVVLDTPEVRVLPLIPGEKITIVSVEIGCNGPYYMVKDSYGLETRLNSRQSFKILREQ